jgi:hypothetical protein
MTDYLEDLGRRGRRAPWLVWTLALIVSVLVNAGVAYQFSRTAVLAERRAVAETTPAQPPVTLVRFVEANPQVPDNPPDPTVQESTRDQQAAQPEPEPAAESPAPQRESELESQTIVPRGEAPEPLAPGVYGAAPAEPTPPEADTPPVPAEASGIPLPSRERELPEWIEPPVTGPGVEIPEPVEGEPDPPEPAPVEEEVPQVLDLRPGGGEPRPAEEAAEETAVPPPAPQGREAQPLPRRRVGADVLEAPLNRSETSAPRRGRLSVDSRVTDYGAYTQRMLEAIQQEWFRLIREVQVSTNFSRVDTVFTVDASGSITDVRITESTAGDLASVLCLDAIYGRAPYGEWTPSMRERLGEQTEVEITFHYR